MGDDAQQPLSATVAAVCQAAGAMGLLVVATLAWGLEGFLGALSLGLYLFGQELAGWNRPGS